MPKVGAALLCAVRPAFVFGIAFVACQFAFLKQPLHNRLIQMVWTKRSSASLLPWVSVLRTSVIAHANYQSASLALELCTPQRNPGWVIHQVSLPPARPQGSETLERSPVSRGGGRWRAGGACAASGCPASTGGRSGDSERTTAAGRAPSAAGGAGPRPWAPVAAARCSACSGRTGAPRRPDRNGAARTAVVAPESWERTKQPWVTALRSSRRRSRVSMMRCSRRAAATRRASSSPASPAGSMPASVASSPHMRSREASFAGLASTRKRTVRSGAGRTRVSAEMSQLSNTG